MTPRKPSRLCIACFRLVATLIALGSAAASAAPITVTFSGRMTSVTDPDGLLDPAVVVDAPFSGTYTLDPAVAGGFPTPNGVVYPLLSPGLSTASVAGVPFSATISAIVIGNDATIPAGVADFWTTAIAVTAFPSPIVAMPVFIDTTLTRLTSTDFFVNEGLAGWSSAKLVLFRVEDGPSGPVPVQLASGLASGGITSLSLFVIPEPATAVLVAGGLCFVAANRMAARRRPTRRLSL